MALSWMFGGKKKDEKYVPPPPEAIEVGSDEDYTIIQARTPLTNAGLYPLLPPAQYSAPQPYSPLPNSLTQDQRTVMAAKPLVQNQLEGVPFILAPSLDHTYSRSPSAKLEDLRRSVFQAAVEINECCYDFNLEVSVIREASVQH